MMKYVNVNRKVTRNDDLKITNYDDELILINHINFILSTIRTTSNINNM